MRKGSLSPGTYLIKGNDSLEDMAGNPSGSELLGACCKFVEGISEVPGDCCGRCHCLESNSVLMDTGRPLNPLTSRKQGFKESSFHCNWNTFFLYPPWVLPNLLHTCIQPTSTIQASLLTESTQGYLEAGCDPRLSYISSVCWNSTLY